jgi:hypothetical protein
MRRFLIRCYPARWRERYGDEFEALLEERPLGPFDVADILLGALDARLRTRGRRAPSGHGRGFTMTLRIGGIAAILGAGLLVAAGLSTFGPATERFASILAVAGVLALLVALVGVSAFQSRTHPRLVWTAFALCAFGTITNLIGGLGMIGVADLSGPWEAVAGLVFLLGVIATIVGFSLFGIATFRAGVLSRTGAFLLVIAPLLWVVAFIVAMNDWDLGAKVVLAAVSAFILGWLILGVQAIRLDQRSTAPRAA